MKEKRNYNLKEHNTFGIEAHCRRYVETSSTAETQAFVRTLTADDKPLVVLGGGSNTLFTADIEGTVLHPAIGGIEVVETAHDYILLRCGSGERWDDVVAYCVRRGMYGAENLSAIPGHVGAAAVQNIGAYGSEIKDIIHAVEAVDIARGGTVCVIPPSHCRYGYRNSRFKNQWAGRFVITHVILRLSPTFTPRLDYGNIRATLAERGIAVPTARELRQAVIDIRRAKLPDPAVMGNAGSFFTNPVVLESEYRRLANAYPDIPHYNAGGGLVKIPAAWLIEQCGWKGKSLGHAGVHERQALVIVNRGGATAVDIIALCRAVQADVSRRFGITLTPEVNFVP